MQIVHDISIVFISIILEAFPFIMLGVILSSIIQEFVSDDTLQKFIPKNPILGSLVGVILGLFIPACDCMVIPISRRLIKKGVPLNVAISFMLASPIINPIVLLSTYYSFSKTLPVMVLYRSVFGIVIAMVIGIIMSITTKKEDVFSKNNYNEFNECNCKHEHEHKHKNFIERINNIILHSKDEFLEIVKYLIIGGLIAAIVQICVPKSLILGLSNNKILEIIILMIFAYVISLCSTADSFVAKTFVSQVSNNSILAFLLVGPMIDIKNTLVLSKSFSKKFTIKLISLIFICVFLATYFIKI